MALADAPSNPLATIRMASPVGDLFIAADAGGLRLVAFLDPGGDRPATNARGGGEPSVPLDEAPPAAAEQARRAVSQLEEYFEGTRRRFDLAMVLDGTPFQRQVWSTLSAIPYGETWSYAQLARAVGRPGASRAVGAANGANPIPVILPCHRVIGADGSLTGYGGGLSRKRWLLAHETRHASPPRLFAD